MIELALSMRCKRSRSASSPAGGALQGTSRSNLFEAGLLFRATGMAGSNFKLSGGPKSLEARHDHRRRSQPVATENSGSVQIRHCVHNCGIQRASSPCSCFQRRLTLLWPPPPTSVTRTCCALALAHRHRDCPASTSDSESPRSLGATRRGHDGASVNPSAKLPGHWHANRGRAARRGDHDGRGRPPGRPGGSGLTPSRSVRRDAGSRQHPAPALAEGAQRPLRAAQGPQDQEPAAPTRSKCTGSASGRGSSRRQTPAAAAAAAPSAAAAGWAESSRYDRDWRCSNCHCQ
jgi:hypothetical protein